MAYLGNKPATGENNAFRILDDISSHVVSFNGSSASVVSVSADTITIAGSEHRYITGQRVTYSKGGGTVITGLTDATAYYVIKDSDTTIQLATTASNANNGVAINLTGLGAGTAHTLTLAFDGTNTKFKPTYNDGSQNPIITRAAQLVISLNGVIQQPIDSASPSTGFGIDVSGNIIFSTAPDANDDFWGHVHASNTVTFDISDNDIDNFTGDGSTANFNLSKTPPNNENILVTLDGVVQYPSDNSNTRAYTLSENELQMVSAPASGVAIQVRHIGFAGPTSGGSGGVTGFYGRTGNVVLKNTDNPVIGNLTANNIVAVDGTFSGNVSIAKTLTYMDVAHIDAVGVITAQNDVNFNGSGAGISSSYWDSSANSLKFKDNVKAEFGDSQDLSIYHSGSHSFIKDTGTGMLKICADMLDFRNAADSATLAYAQEGNKFELFHNGTSRLVTTGTGVNITDTLNVAGVVTASDNVHIGEWIAHIGDLNTTIGFPANDTITLNTSSTERLRIDSNGNVNIGPSATPRKRLDITGPDGRSGASSGNTDTALIIDNDGGNGAIMEFLSDNNAYGRIFFTDTDASNRGQIVYEHGNDAFQFTTAGTERLRINSNGRVNIANSNQTGSHLDYTRLNVYGQTAHAGTDKNLNLLNVYNYGSGNVGDITGIGLGCGASPGGYTKASIGFIRTGSYGRGDLTFYINSQGNGNQVAESDEKLRITSSGSIGIGTVSPDQTLELFKDTGTNLVKVTSEANSTIGIELEKTGATTQTWRIADGQTVNGMFQIYDVTDSKTPFNIDTGQRVLLGSTTSRFYAAKLQVQGTSDTNYILMHNTSAGDGDGNRYSKFIYSGTQSGGETSDLAHINAAHDGSADDQKGRLEFRINTGSSNHSPTEVLRIDSSGHLTPGASGTQNLGSTSKEWGDLYFANSKGLKLGSSQVGDLYNDGTDTYFRNSVSNGQMLLRADGNILISNYAANEYRIKTFNNGAVELYYDQSSHATAKLATTATGVSVHGEVATSQDYPVHKPSLDFNFARVKKLDSRLTFSRTGPASYVDENGYVKIVGSNIPRFDHDPVTRESKGLLAEQSVGNWIKYGTDLSGSGWTTNNVTNTLASTVVAPDGTTGSVYECKENNSSNYHATYFSANIPVTSGQYYTVSCWIKKGPNYRTDISSGNYQFYCSRGTGSVASISINSDFDTINAHTNTTSRSLTKYRNGWIRVTYTFQSNQNSGNVVPHWLLGNGGNYLGNGTSSVYIWGCQFESMRFPTSYIPTNGSIIFRGTDDVTLDGTEFTDVFNPIEGTSVVYAHMPNSNGAAGLPAYTFKNSSVSSVHLGLSRDDNGSPAYHYYHDGSNNGFARASATGDNMYKGALSFKTSDLDSYVNGSANTNTTTFTMPTIDNLRIGGTSGANYVGGHVARFIYYPVKLTNNQLATLTS